MPQNLPGFGFNHDNAAQNASIIWTRMYLAAAGEHRVARDVPAVHVPLRGKQLHATTSWASSGLRASVSADPAGWGAPYFNVQGYSPFGDTWLATPMQIVGHRRRRPRYAELAAGHAQPQIRRQLPPVHLADVGAGAEPRLLLIHLRLHHPDGDQRRHRLRAGQFPARTAGRRGSCRTALPSMNLRQWYADAFVQDTWRITPRTTLDVGLRYEYMSPLVDISRNWSNLLQQDGKLLAFIGGQNGMPRGLMYPNKLRFAPRFGMAHHFEKTGLVLRAAYGIFYTPVDMNTWCNQLHNAPHRLSDTQQSDNFTPGINGFNFPQPVLGTTVTSFSAFDPYPPAQYIQQWSASVQKSLGATPRSRSATRANAGFICSGRI